MAGDMFAAALLHAVPEALADVQRVVAAATAAQCETTTHDDGTLTGLRFRVPVTTEPHGHTHWAAIRRHLLSGALDDAVARHAVGIFEILAAAEARVHGTSPDEVVFHEAGAVDSIADVTAAAVLIARLAPSSVSVSSLPLGRGRIETAHGLMPVPAPAVAILLEGFETIDDGIEGERVTPTGAAILRYLAPSARSAAPRRLVASGYGFGARRLPGISNCLRATLFDDAVAQGAAVPHRLLSVIAFEVDDQSAEDLAAGIDRMRAHEGIHDVIQIAAIGKKGRLATHLQVLADERHVEQAIDLCFRETTTIGLRVQRTEARALTRRTERVSADGHEVRVKVVDRPGGETAKPEADDLVSAGDAAARHARAAQVLKVRRGVPR